MPIRKTASVKGGQHVFAAMSLLTTHSPLTHSSMSCRTHFSSLLAQGTLNKISFFSVHRPEVNEEVGLLVTSFHTCQRPSFTKRAGRVVPLSHGRRPRKHALHATVVSAFMHAPALCAHTHPRYRHAAGQAAAIAPFFCFVFEIFALSKHENSKFGLF